MSAAVLYRWRIAPGSEAEFEAAWLEGTRLIHECCDSHGARLHKGADGLYWSYARWPSEAARKACFRKNDFYSRPCFKRMQACLVERFEEIVLEIRADALDEARPLPG